jgi:ankyrin repeat protein
MDADGNPSSDTDDNSEPDEILVYNERWRLGEDDDEADDDDDDDEDDDEDDDDYSEEDEDENESDDGVDKILWNACDCGDETTVTRLILPDANGVLPVSCCLIEAEYDGKTPLLAAVCGGHDRVVQMLLNAGASIKATFGIHPYRIGEGFTGIMTCAMQGQTSMMQVLLDHDSSLIDKRSTDGFTAFEYAIARNHIDMVRILLKYGADVNLQGGRRRVQTPLFMATGENHIEMIEILLANGANPIYEDDYGETALTGSAWEQSIEAIEMLLAAGGDMNQQNAKRVTVLHMCAKWNLIVTAKYLLKRGASIDIKAKSGRTASDVADRYGHVEMSNMIKAEGVRRAQREAFCMCLDQRIGVNSLVGLLDNGVVRMISDYV